MPLSRSAMELYLAIFSLPHNAFLLSLLFLASGMYYAYLPILGILRLLRYILSGIMEAVLGGPIDIIFFCLAFCAVTNFCVIGRLFIANTPEANIKLMNRFATFASVVVFVIGVVCSVHIARSS
jgi:hypothetical protein